MHTVVEYCILHGADGTETLVWCLLLVEVVHQRQSYYNKNSRRYKIADQNDHVVLDIECRYQLPMIWLTCD